jgi:hypothetical protein
MIECLFYNNQHPKEKEKKEQEESLFLVLSWASWCATRLTILIVAQGDQF